jgi:hypothetical protein
VTAKLPQYVAECVTFSAPGISEADAESLKDRRIPTTHHRTEGDIVPAANSQAAPGTIVTYERFNRADNNQSWNRERNPGTLHNNMPVRGALNFTPAARRTPQEQRILTQGASGPTESDAQDRSISVISSVRPTGQDRLFHAGEKLLALQPGVTHLVFYANLGYNLLVEYVQQQVARLDPKKLSKAALDERLTALVLRVEKIASLPLTAEAYELYDKIDVDRWDQFHIKRPRLKLGQAIALRAADRAAVALQVNSTWMAWWPGR